MPRDLFEELITKCLIVLGVSYIPRELIVEAKQDLKIHLEDRWMTNTDEEFIYRFHQWLIDDGIRVKYYILKWLKGWYLLWRRRAYYFNGV